jgi:hypothetical protein
MHSSRSHHFLAAHLLSRRFQKLLTPVSRILQGCNFNQLPGCKSLYILRGCRHQYSHRRPCRILSLCPQRQNKFVHHFQGWPRLSCTNTIVHHFRGGPRQKHPSCDSNDAFCIKIHLSKSSPFNTRMQSKLSNTMSITYIMTKARKKQSTPSWVKKTVRHGPRACATNLDA